mmetsp:Transcript_16827/g.39471  ORF Transcript_16827/g.39471 Transcript_16827/m.39471 type:complete len:169 (+) Transcript_16827:285-791(+)
MPRAVIDRRGSSYAQRVHPQRAQHPQLREDAEEGTPEFFIRILENRCRANNWISETCPRHHRGNTKRWMVDDTTVEGRKHLQRKALHGMANKGVCSFDEWLAKRERQERRSHLISRMKLAALLPNLQSENQVKMVKGLRATLSTMQDLEPTDAIQAETGLPTLHSARG